MLNRYTSYIDWYLFVPSFLLTFLGLFVLYDPLAKFGGALFAKQAIWLLFATLIFVFVSRMDLSFIKNGKLLLLLYFVSVIVLIFILFFADIVKGASSRIDLFGVSIQPTDPIKIVLIALLAKYFEKRHTFIADIKHIIITGIYTAVLFLLLALQPDLGSALVMGAIWFFVILFSGLNKKHFIFMLLSLSLISAGAWQFALKDYQKKRIISFLNPGADIYGSGYNVRQAKIAIGSGGFWGKGIAYGTQSRLNYLPEYETDFIFAAFAEEWGFVGVTLMLILFLVLFSRIFYIAFSSNSNFTILFAIGVFAMFFTHFTINIGMNLGLLPVTGVPLPFLSYGGSHLVVEFLALAILSSLKREENIL